VANLVAPKFHVKVSGLPTVMKALKSLGDKGPKALGGALFREGESIMGDSKEKFVPVVTGNLRSSGHVDKPKITTKGASVELGFGGPAAPYALAVHENPNTGKTAEGSRVGEWKYLETPYKQHLKDMDERVAKDMRAQLPETR
jgi:hypothetical protein